MESLTQRKPLPCLPKSWKGNNKLTVTEQALDLSNESPA